MLCLKQINKLGQERLSQRVITEVLPHMGDGDMEVIKTLLRTEQREHHKPVRLLLGGNRSRGRGTTGIAIVLGEDYHIVA